jgi:hypothetical protein
MRIEEWVDRVYQEPAGASPGELFIDEFKSLLREAGREWDSRDEDS